MYIRHRRALPYYLKFLAHSYKTPTLDLSFPITALGVKDLGVLEKERRREGKKIILSGACKTEYPAC